MLKRASSPYAGRGSAATGGSGRSNLTRSMRCSSTLEPGNGKRANLFTDYTFGVWDGDESRTDREGLFRACLMQEIPESGLPLFGGIRSNVSVRSARRGRASCSSSASRGSSRDPPTRSGVAVRFPRMLRWRRTSARRRRIRSRACGACSRRSNRDDRERTKHYFSARGLTSCRRVVVLPRQRTTSAPWGRCRTPSSGRRGRSRRRNARRAGDTAGARGC